MACITLNLVLDLVLSEAAGHVGIALATSIASWINAGLLLWTLARRGQFTPDARLRDRTPRTIAASLGMAAVLAARGDAVRVVDDLSTASRRNLAEHPDVELIEADRADPPVAEAAVSGVECAIHMAAIPSAPRSVQEPRRARRANVDATRALLLAARDAGVRRVVLASSSSVYGESSALPAHEARLENQHTWRWQSRARSRRRATR